MADTFADFQLSPSWTIDLDPNGDSMYRMNGHRNALHNFRQKINCHHSGALWLHMVLDYPETMDGHIVSNDKINISIANNLIVCGIGVCISLPCDNCKKCSCFLYQLQHSPFRHRCSCPATTYSNCPTIWLHSNRNLCQCRQPSNHDRSTNSLCH